MPAMRTICAAPAPPMAAAAATGRGNPRRSDFVRGRNSRAAAASGFVVLGKHDLFASGLASVGLHLEDVIYAEASRASDVLLLMEEELRHSSLGGVVGELPA